MSYSIINLRHHWLSQYFVHCWSSAELIMNFNVIGIIIPTVLDQENLLRITLLKCDILSARSKSNILVQKLVYFMQTTSISCLQMPWPLTSPDHQQPCYWLCTINVSLQPMREKLNCTHNISIKKSSITQIYFCVSKNLFRYKIDVYLIKSSNMSHSVHIVIIYSHVIKRPLVLKYQQITSLLAINLSDLPCPIHASSCPAYWVRINPGLLTAPVTQIHSMGHPGGEMPAEYITILISMA